MTEPEVMEYNSVEDLEDTIEQVYDRVNQLDRHMERLEIGTEIFLDTNYLSRDFEPSAEYVSGNIQHEAWPVIAMEYAQKELENPQEADNWDKLEEASQLADGMDERFRDTYEKLWGEFGIDSEELDERYPGSLPFPTFLHVWNENPAELFEDLGSRENYRFRPERVEPGADRDPYEGLSAERKREMLADTRDNLKWINEDKLNSREAMQ